MHRLIAIAGLAAATLSLPAGAADTTADDIVGVWQTPSGGYLQIYSDGRVYDGRIVGSADGKARNDTNNPDAAMRDRRLLGQVILHGLKPGDDGHYRDGTIYDPDSGKSYRAQATLKNHDTLDARGYVGFSLLGKTQTWHRIDSASANVHADLLHHPVGDKPAP